jgi:hypothetical protein
LFEGNRGHRTPGFEALQRCHVLTQVGNGAMTWRLDAHPSGRDE